MRQPASTISRTPHRTRPAGTPGRDEICAGEMNSPGIKVLPEAKRLARRRGGGEERDILLGVVVDEAAGQHDIPLLAGHAGQAEGDGALLAVLDEGGLHGLVHGLQHLPDAGQP